MVPLIEFQQPARSQDKTERTFFEGIFSTHGVEWVDNYFSGPFVSTGSIIRGAYNREYLAATHEGVHEEYYKTILSGEKDGFYWSRLCENSSLDCWSDDSVG